MEEYVNGMQSADNESSFGSAAGGQDFTAEERRAERRSSGTQYDCDENDCRPGRKKKHTGRRVAAALMAVLLVAALGFGGGYAGALIASRITDTDSGSRPGGAHVVIQQSQGGHTVSSVSGSSAMTSEEVAAATVPSVVAITTENVTTSNSWYGSRVSSGAGSGVILSSDGYILTNYHVVTGADKITVETCDGTEYPAELVGTYRDGDLAVIKIDASGLSPVTFADTDSVVQGETVYAVGNPEGTFSGSITMGILSALDRTISVTLEERNGRFITGYTVNLDVFQFDAAVSPGNSGGGLFNAYGELIGIVCAKSSDTDSEGLAFAIIGNNALGIASDIIENGAGSGANTDNGDNTNPAVIGITAVYLDSATASFCGFASEGVYVLSVTSDSAVKAGITSGDRIVSIDGNEVRAVSDITDYLAGKNPGDEVSLTVERSDKTFTVTVTLSENK